MQRNYLFLILLFAATLILSACGASTTGWDTPQGAPTAPTQATQGPTAQPLPPISQDDVTRDSLEPLSSSPVPPSGVTKVALLLPLSGPSEQTGQALLNAAQLALFDLKAEGGFELMPRDTKGNAQSAAEQASSAIKDGAQLILGPLFSAEAKAVAATGLQNNVTSLSFSTDSAAASGSGFIMGFLPQTQIEHVLSFAQSKGRTRIGLIAPRDAYGDMSAQIFDQTLRARGVTHSGVLRYDGTRPTPEMIKNFLGAHSVMDGVLIAANAQTAAQISAQLTANGFPPARVQRLGTGLWDQANAPRMVELSGAWFATTAPSARARFETQYQSTYGVAAPRIASLAYDATALAIVLNRSGAPYTRQTLQNPSGFAGVDGVFRFNQNGVVERRLAILEMTPQGPRVIEQAARNF